MGHPVVHFEVGGNDRKQLERFYGQVFDWKIHSHDEMHYGLVEAAERGIGGGISGSIPNGPSSWVTFYVQVDDLEAYLKKIESVGGKTIVPPTPIPNTGSFAWFSDPAGNCIGLFREGA
ncbi:MAG: VOC family protein [Candidatus Latescibacteria bacterium]|nr:VOC family protein [Candidatus Latescibacterota bacterium]